MKTTYHGGCHCGAVRYEVSLDLSEGTTRCNCSYCSKARWWGAIARPDDFRLISGEDVLADYQFGSKQGHHLFCRRCGIHSFGRGDIPDWIGPYVSINVACLEGIADADKAALPITFNNGRDNDWFNRPAVTAYL